MTHHQHIRVDLVHLGKEEAKQSPLCSSYLHLPILTKGQSLMIGVFTYSQ